MGCDVAHGDHSSVTLRRRDLTRPRRVLLSSRLCRELSVGAVGRLTFLVTVTLLINSCRRCRASVRFFSRVRYLPALMTTTPSLLMRWSLRFRRRCLYSSGSDEARISKRRCIAVDTLLTFCPPAPRARMAEISISSSGTDILRVYVVKAIWTVAYPICETVQPIRLANSCRS